MKEDGGENNLKTLQLKVDLNKWRIWKKIVVEWVGRWMDGCSKSSLNDCLQQSKKLSSKSVKSDNSVFYLKCKRSDKSNLTLNYCIIIDIYYYLIYFKDVLDMHFSNCRCCRTVRKIKAFRRWMDTFIECWSLHWNFKIVSTKLANSHLVKMISSLHLQVEKLIVTKTILFDIFFKINFSFSAKNCFPWWLFSCHLDPTIVLNELIIPLR